ncbi:helix-turn-helix domain-containing protein [Roseburia sp. 499]|uniref:helix-turn-helix domain-containing protein n=1 Tax=Roseburia sp. 499 TaxID=1261634 RepID=UPI000950EA99|nr:helix-turn-helix transcriptional regulator [Roseburia sp. 499]WVK70589.1 helix-turn-helix transcriptional regulator [Roseburia sp. 499]
MEIGKQIKKYRLELNLSQDDLAEKIFVTRQTISNWENDKNYPDIKSLLLLSSLFDTSLDILVKGDLEEMKEQIKAEDVKQFNHDGAIFSFLLLGVVVSAIPLFLFLDFIGIGIWALLFIITMYYALRIEKQKKAHDIQTYKEIVAFSEGKKLSESEKGYERVKRPYQNILCVIGSALITLVICMVIAFFLR